MKKFKFAAFIMAAILSCSFITSCGDDEDEPQPSTTVPGGNNGGQQGGGQQGGEVSILGTWAGIFTYEDKGEPFQQHMELTFNADNTCVTKVWEDNYYNDTMYGTYVVYGNLASGATVKITYTSDRQPYTETWSIRINGNTAVMINEDGESVTLTRQSSGDQPQQGNEGSILGTWTGILTYEDKGETFQEHIEITFKDNNTCVVTIWEENEYQKEAIWGTYVVNGNLATIQITDTSDGETYTATWSFSFNGNTAIMTDEEGESVTLTRH